MAPEFNTCKAVVEVLAVLIAVPLLALMFKATPVDRLVPEMFWIVPAVVALASTSNRPLLAVDV